MFCWLFFHILRVESVIAGSSQRAGVTRESKANLLGNEMVKPDAYASNSAVSGPSGSGHGIYQASAPHIGGKCKRNLSAYLQTWQIIHIVWCWKLIFTE